MMEWPRNPLREVAPARPCQYSLRPDDTIWHLGLDQIESHTGVVLAKQRKPFSAAGTSTFYFDERYVLYSKLRPYLNKVVVPDEPGIATTELIPLQPLPNLVTRKFLAYYLRSPVFLAYASQYVTGAKMPRVILDRFWAHELPVPSISEQNRIVEILDQADRLRGLCADAYSKTDRIFPALFAQLLGAPGSWTNDPRSRRLKDLVKFVSGATPSKRVPRYWNGNIPWISPKDVKQDFLSESQDHVSSAALQDTRLTLVEAGTPVIVVRGMILARDVPVALTQCAATINQDMKALVPTTSRVSGAFLWASLMLAKTYLRTLVRTSAHGTRKLDTPDLMRIPIAVPGPETVGKVDAAARRLRWLQIRLLRRRNVINYLNAALIAHAFDGSLTRSWREANMKELVQEMTQQARGLEPAVVP